MADKELTLGDVIKLGILAGVGVFVFKGTGWVLTGIADGVTKAVQSLTEGADDNDK